MSGCFGVRLESSEIEARGDSETARRVGEIVHPGERSSLLIECQERALVGDVVDEEGDVPGAGEDSDPLTTPKPSAWSPIWVKRDPTC